MYLFDERFAEAFIHGKQRWCFGARLKPFSYWHKVQLEYIQSKVLLGGPAKWDIWLAAQVCRTSYPVNAKFPPRGKWWQLWWNVWYGWRSFNQEVNALYAHISDYASPPKLWSGKGGSKKRLAEALEALHKETKLPELLDESRAWAQSAAFDEAKDRDLDDSIEQIAIYTRQGRPPAEAWNMPMGELLWYNACFLKMEGADVPIWTPKDDYHFETQKQRRAVKVGELADALQEKKPILTRNIALAQAAVDYWKGVVQSQERG